MIFEFLMFYQMEANSSEHDNTNYSNVYMNLNICDCNIIYRQQLPMLVYISKIPKAACVITIIYVSGAFVHECSVFGIWGFQETIEEV